MDRLALKTAVLAAVLLLTCPVSCLTAWWTALSPQLAMQDPVTGRILHSACNSNSTPIFPNDGLNVLTLQTRPKSSTPLVGAGWYDSQKKQTVASVFYQSEDGTIVNAVLDCDMTTGHYSTTGEYAISVTAGVKSIHANTGLAVELLSAESGYRVFFHDEGETVNAMSYTTKTDWQSLDQISQDRVPSMALASVHSGQLNVSVIFPKDSENLEISRYFKDDTWHQSTFPRPLIDGTATNNTNASDITVESSLGPAFTLPAWTQNRTNLGATIDGSYVRSVFYIGTDVKLHQVSNIGSQWKLMPDQNSLVWPMADEADGALATTSNLDTNEIWLWYRANGSLVQLYHGTDGLWTQASAVPSSNTTKSAEEGPNGAGQPAPLPGAAENPVGLSTGAKAGIAVGVSVAVVALLVVGVLFHVMRQRRKLVAEAARLEKIKAAGEGLHPDEGCGNSERGAGGPRQQAGIGMHLVEADGKNTTPAPQELDAGERYELVGEGQWNEMDATGQNQARRSVGGWREVQAGRKRADVDQAE